MNLVQIMKLGYAIVIGSILIMIWISLAESKKLEVVNDPPCFFNPLCTCSQSAPGLGYVRCENVHLPRIPETVNTSTVYTLHLENNQMRVLEPYFLQSTHLYEIVISKNPLSTLTEEAFIGLERSLSKLELSYCDLTEVPRRVLKYLQKLERLDLTGNDINKISPEDFRGIEHTLKVLVLAENEINALAIDSFTGLPNLDTIDLSGNNLREIDPSVFRDGMGRLEHLIFADNQLSSIPYQALQPLRVLKTLDLSHNRIDKMDPSTEPGTSINLNFQLNLDTFRLDYNQLTVLQPGSFQYFNVVNKTYLDGNPLISLQEKAFRQARIKELYIRSCGLTDVNPAAFDGLESYLEILDLSGNNISLLPEDLFHGFQTLRTLFLNDNVVKKLKPIEDFTGVQLTLYDLDLSGNENLVISLQELRRLRNLRTLTISKLNQPTLSPENFAEYGVDLEKLNINFGNLQTIKNHAFRQVHGLKSLDLSENSIGTIENSAFVDIDHSLTSLKLSHGLSSSISSLPTEALKVLTNLEKLDFSNNKLKSVPETSFHFLRELKKLELQDNMIEIIHKGTFQGDIHKDLLEIYLSFNYIRFIGQHTFVYLPKLEQLHLDDNKIESIDKRAFMNLENIKRLNLKGNQITTVSFEAFQNLPKLEDLDMSYNSLKAFDFTVFDQVGTLSIFRVNVSHNDLTDLFVNLPVTFEASAGYSSVHSSIKILDLSYNNISSISKQFFRPVEMSLTHLHMSHNNMLNASRDVFGGLRFLQWLDISHNGMYEMDFDMFRNTKKLQVLIASHNLIADISSDLFRFLNNLRIVDLSHNRLKALAENLFREEGLEKLDLSHNMLDKMPLTSMSVPAANTVCELDFSWNAIYSLQHKGILRRFKKLNYLDLSYNRLAQIDAGIFEGLPRLSYLDLSHNNQLSLEPNGQSFKGLEFTLLHLKLDNVSLSSLPTFPTTHLISLSFASNGLPSVPPEMTTNLTKLQRLNLAHNDLTAIPIVTHQLSELRYFSIAGNPITFLSNTSLLGLADHLLELDLRKFELETLESGVFFCKMYSLRSLKIDYSPNVKNFNIPTLLERNTGLRNLEIHVDSPTDNNLDKEMIGELPIKLRNITFTGNGLKKLGGHVLSGVRSPIFHLGVHNTSILKLASNIFDSLTHHVKNVTVDVRNNNALQTLLNPSRGYKPNLYKRPFLIDLKITGNKWTCDCDLGWVEVWLRKRRQYLCGDSPRYYSARYYDNPDYTCRHVEDDLRTALCHNKHNRTVIDVLKTDIECGWSSSTHLTGVSLVSLILIVTIQIL